MRCDELKRLEQSYQDVSITSLIDNQGVLWRIEARCAGQTRILGEAREFDEAVADALANVERAHRALVFPRVRRDGGAEPGVRYERSRS